MPDQCFLAFDFGLKKIGVAVGNSITKEAAPLAIIKTLTRAARFEAVEKILHEWQPNLVIVGLPLTTEGEEQDSSRQARRFANQLEGRYNISTILVDERGSSMQAQALLGNNSDDDAYAAAIILQRYLDTL